MTTLMSPAGDLEKLKYAVLYGADAVYLGGKDFGMRAGAGNFTLDEMREGVLFAHERDARVEVTLNIAARDDDIPEMVSYAKKLRDIGVDGLIVADAGVVYQLKNELPDMFLTLSTQANSTNGYALDFWKQNGVNRIVLARELTFEQLKLIALRKPEGMAIEVFVHGAMCISYSGRCLISNYLAGRDSNRGECAQPCRWQYSLSEKTRQGEYFDIEEDGNGSYFFNSKDLCLIENIPELMDIGVDCFKIEGRMKSIFYVATVTSAYKTAMKRAADKSASYRFVDLYEELTKVSHRQYTKAFFDGRAGSESQNYGTGGYARNYDFIAQVLEDTNEDGLCRVVQRNKFSTGDRAEAVTPLEPYKSFEIQEIYDKDLTKRLDAPHPMEELYIKTGMKLKKYDLIRCKCAK